ncbi:MAG: ABC transporter permease [Halobacteriota archaeon]
MGIKRAVRHSMWIAWKDLLDFSRNRMGLVMLIVMPLFMMGMVGFIFPSNTNPTNVPVALANLDAGHGNSSLSAKFVTQLEAANNKSKMMDLSTVPSADDVKTAIQNGDESAGIVIGKNFTSDLMAGKQGGITVVIDQSNPQMSMLMQTALTQVIQQMGSQTAMHSLNQTYKTPLNYTLSQITPYKIGSTGIVPGQPNYFQFVAPGIMAMVMMMSLMTGLPHAISYEREVGTLDGMLVAPVHRISVIGGKVIAQTTRGMIQGVIILALAVILFGVVINGSVALVIGLMLLSVFSFVGLGILITSFMSTEETANMVMMSFMFPMMFLSGVFFPLQQMPQFMQIIARFLPLTYAVTALRRVVVLGAGVPSIATDIVILFGFGIILLSVALVMFERAVTTQ